MNSNNWKDTFRQVYKPLLKDKYDEFEEALAYPKSRHIRLNLSRQVDYLKEIKDYATFEELENYKGVYKILEEKENLVNSLSFQTGGLYIMNPSSVIPAEILSSYMAENPVVLDVCAAPGGKTCALSDYLNRKGLIIANEVSSSRLKSLHFNLEKNGCYNVKTVSFDGRVLNKFFKNSFDGILLDAPCSNENKIFRDKTVQNIWNKDLVLKMANLQSQLIETAFDCLKEGGILVYSTCTLSVEENELVVKNLVDKYSNAKLLNIENFSGNGLSNYSEIDEKVARIMPTKTSIDGFFVAVIKKDGNLIKNEFKENKLYQKQKDFFKKYIDIVPENINILDINGKGYIESGLNIFKKIPYKKIGLNVYKTAGKDFIPSAQFVWEFNRYIKDNEKIFVNKDNAMDYMKGFDLKPLKEYKGSVIYYDNIGVGLVKSTNDTLKNKLDRYFLYGKNIEW